MHQGIRRSGVETSGIKALSVPNIPPRELTILPMIPVPTVSASTSEMCAACSCLTYNSSIIPTSRMNFTWKIRAKHSSHGIKQKSKTEIKIPKEKRSQSWLRVFMCLLHTRSRGNHLSSSRNMLRDNLACKCQDLHLAPHRGLFWRT